MRTHRKSHKILAINFNLLSSTELNANETRHYHNLGFARQQVLDDHQKMQSGERNGGDFLPEYPAGMTTAVQDGVIDR